jgi:hypothetical protein
MDPRLASYPPAAHLSLALVLSRWARIAVLTLAYVLASPFHAAGTEASEPNLDQPSSVFDLYRTERLRERARELQESHRMRVEIAGAAVAMPADPAQAPESGTSLENGPHHALWWGLLGLGMTILGLKILAPDTCDPLR